MVSFSLISPFKGMFVITVSSILSKGTLSEKFYIILQVEAITLSFASCSSTWEYIMFKVSSAFSTWF